MTLLTSGILIVSIILIIFSLTLAITMITPSSISIVEKNETTIKNNHYTAYASPSHTTKSNIVNFKFAAAGD